MKHIIRCNAIISMQYLCNDNMQCPFCSHRIMQCNIRSAKIGSNILAIRKIRDFKFVLFIIALTSFSFSSINIRFCACSFTDLIVTNLLYT